MRNNLWKFLVPFVLILALSIGSLFLVKSRVSKVSSERGIAEITPGTVLPDFVLNKISGGKVHVSELKFRVLLINFWATWCEACMVEMPSINRLREKFKNQGFEAAGITLDENPDAVVPKVVKRLGIGFPIFNDPDSTLAELFDVRAIPLTVLINKDRKILYVEPGERDWTDARMISDVNGWLSK